MAYDQIDTPELESSGDYKKVMGLQDPLLRKRMEEVLRNNSREAYVKRLERIGVIVTKKYGRK